MSFELLNYQYIDKDFYNKNYSNQNMHKKELFQHWIEQGKNNNCALNKDQLINRYNSNIKFYNDLILLEEFKENEEIIFNILIRTSNRKEYFKTCYESILKQNFKGKINIFVSYDNKETLKYLKEYNDLNIIKCEKGDKKYSFNLYCNDLLKEVKEGWIIFLDDDNKFINYNCLSLISDKIANTNELIIWKFIKPDKVIKPQEIFKKGEIDTSCFCFNYLNKDKSEWIDEKCSDFYYFNNLVNREKFNRKYIDLALVTTSYCEQVASLGN